MALRARCGIPSTAVPAMALPLLLLAFPCQLAHAALPTLAEACPKEVPGATPVTATMSSGAYAVVPTAAAQAQIPTVNVAASNAVDCEKSCIAASKQSGTTFYFWEILEQGLGIPGTICTCTGGGPCNGPDFRVIGAPYQTVTIGTFDGVQGSTVGGDPHFVGAHGTRFDFNGELGAAYCLVTDTGFHLNALLDGYKSAGTVGGSIGGDGKGTHSWIRDLGIMWVDASGASHSLHLAAHKGKLKGTATGLLGNATVDGTELAVPAQPGTVFNGNGLRLEYKGVTRKTSGAADTYTLIIGDEIVLGIQVLPALPQLQLPRDSLAHFDVTFNRLKTSSRVHGILGQTFRDTPAQCFKALKYSTLGKLLGEPVKADGASGEGFLDGDVALYKVSDVLSPDCKVSAFHGSAQVSS